MLIYKKPSKVSINSKSRDLANTRKHGELSRSIINIDNDGAHILKQISKINGIASVKQSLDRTNSENKSGGRDLKDFRKTNIRGKRLGESKNSKGSKSSNQSLAKMKKETGLEGQLSRLIDLVRKLSPDDMPEKLCDRLSGI